MTAYELAQAAMRRWYVLFVGIIMTVMLAYSSAPESVYWGSVELRVSAPIDPVAPKTLTDPDIDPVAAATMLMTLVNQGHLEPQSASPETTLYGEGKRRAVEARVRDVGGQWTSSVRHALIDVQAVDSTPSAVLARLEERQVELSRLLSQLQDQLNVAQSQRIPLLISPLTGTDVVQVTGSRTRAVALTLLIGVTLTFMMIYRLDTLARGSLSADLLT